MKYRRKPVIVEAFQWQGGRHPSNEPKWLTDAFHNGIVQIVEDDFGQYMEIKPDNMPNPTELQTAITGDYIIRGAFGEIYSCKAWIFELTHDPLP